jgi:hypothetical protein
MPQIYQYVKLALRVDAVVFGLDGCELKVLGDKKRFGASQGAVGAAGWIFPGG